MLNDEQTHVDVGESSIDDLKRDILTTHTHTHTTEQRVMEVRSNFIYTASPKNRPAQSASQNKRGN